MSERDSTRCPYSARTCVCVPGSVMHAHCMGEADRTDHYATRHAMSNADRMGLRKARKEHGT